MSKNVSLVILIPLVLASFPAFSEAKTNAPIDKLQSTRTETIQSLLSFMRRIFDLDEKVQNKLLRARLTNTLLTYRDAKKIRWGDPPWEHDASSSVETGEDEWTLTVITADCAQYSRSDDGEKTCRHVVETKLIIHIEPTSEMKEWMNARDEYVEYSRNELAERYLSLNISGKISPSFIMHATTGGCESLDTRNCISLELRLKEETPEKLVIYTPYRGVYSGTLRNQIEILESATAKWVKYLMGKGGKPKPLF